MTAEIGLEDRYTMPGGFWHRLDDGRVQSDVCPAGVAALKLSIQWSRMDLTFRRARLGCRCN